MKTPLAQRTCEPCKGGVPPLTGREMLPLLQELGNDWEAAGTHHLQKTYRFKNFADALAFVNRAGDVAEREAHHPNIFLTWGSVRLEIWTHKIDGLTEADFILAAKCDAAL
ncbi:MAG TPA: 4a-hydroxytetrahydrobiopterin dehydratase [Candidatus Baltobacteraceae bacterium]|jgi:4a-hydroxytetrahydrobiopterin dehydratase